MQPLPFVRQLPSATGTPVAVSVAEVPTPMRQSSRCRRWMELVHDGFIRPDPGRVDRNWDWRWQIPLITFGGGLVRRPRMFQLCRASDAFPLGMLALLENERSINDHAQSAVYVWYLTGAPDNAVRDRGAPKGITTAVLDIAVTLSLNGPAQGRLWLHAHPVGGERLLDWYRSRGLASVPPDTILPGPAIVGRPNDGRYLHLDEAGALEVSHRLAGWR